MKMRLALSILLPFVACAVQWLLWDMLKPYVWFLFFPTAFFSAWIGGLAGGLAATVICMLLVWYIFMPPAFSFFLDNPASIFSIAVFLVMGSLFAFVFERLRCSKLRAEEALAAAEAANEKITQLYRKTLELDELKTQFFANVSHELRTPLTLILAPLERRLCHPIDACFSATEYRETEIMLRNARLLYRHVSDLLDAAKFDAGRMTLAWTHLDLARLARTMASHFESLAKERHINYSVIVPNTLPAAADSEKLQRVLLNLLSNAFKFTPDGGSITLQLSHTGGYAQFEVRDNGPGVPVELREVVFERFRQSDGDVRRRHGGTGLGLSIVKDLVELHNGTVTLDETPGGGALFSVRLPLTAPPDTLFVPSVSLDAVIDRQTIEELEMHAPETTQVAAPIPVDAPLILVVEDNADMNEYIATTLRPRYRVVSAYDGREGLDQALALHPDLILSDLMMPVMSGDEMVAALRQEASMADVPIVILTAKADDTLLVRLLKEGVQDYLNKPFAEAELLARVDGFIKERKRTAEKLNESEARFEATFEQAAVGIALVAPNGRWLRVNRKLCEIVGYSREDLLACTFQDITHPDDLNADLIYVRQMLANEIQTYTIEKRYIRQDGGLRWINLTVALVWRKDGTPDYFISVIEDIQRRKEAELALAEQETQYRAVIETAADGFWMLDEQGHILVTNDAYVRRSGYSRKELLTMCISDLDDQESQEEIYAHIEKVRCYGSDLFETRHRTKNGEIWPVEVNASHWATAAGERYFGFLRDIGERKLAEEEIRSLNADLERRVFERTTELTVANRELDSFAYAVSHDLRAPLRAMSGFSQALQEDYGAQLQGEAKVYLDQINFASCKMNELIDGLLELSRSTRGELKYDAVDLSALAERLLAELAQAEPERQLTVAIESGLQMHGDARMIEVVIRNLLSNAWKYTVHTEQPSISVYAGEREGGRCFCVADNGAGFDMAHANRLFQPFQRLHRQEEFPGIGIGLATVQRIVQRHGGRIEVRGEPGKGAVFCFTLSERPADLMPGEKDVAQQ